MPKRPSHTRQRILAYIGLALACAIAATFLYQRIERNFSHIQRFEQVQSAAIYSSCVRLNILRASDNRSHYADYRFFTLTTRLLARNIRHPQRKLTSVEKAQTRQFVVSLKSTSKDKTWIPLTNCDEALKNPITFKIPTPVHFTDKLPPAADLNVSKQERQLGSL